MPIAPVLLRFVDEELARMPALIERTLNGTLQLLRDARDSPLAAAERTHQFTLVEALRTRATDYQRAFVQALQDGAREALQAQEDGAADDERAVTANLELMDESRVEIDIEISRAIQLIDTTAEWELRELQTFTSTLIGQTHVSAESNPFRPQICAGALWDAACAVSPLLLHRTMLLRISSGVAAGLLRTSWAAACTRLESQGVEPGIYRSILIGVGAAPGRGPAQPDVNNASAMASLLASMPGGSAAMHVGVSNAAVAMGTAPTRATPRPPSAEFEQALARLDEMLRHLPDASASEAVEASNRRLNAQRAALAASAGTPHERQVIELVSRVFDAMAEDPQVAPAFAPVVARLRASALRVALHDPEVSTTTRHAVWQLIDRIGEIGHAAPQPGDPRGATLLGLCRALTDQLANAPAPDATMYRRAQNQLDALLVNQLAAQLQAEQPRLQTLHQAERRELLEQRLSQRLIEQMAPVRATASVRRFVTGTWARVLAEAITRDGELAESTHQYIKMVDELLWSLQLPDHPKSRQRLIGLLPGMLKRLRTGMDLIKLPASEQESVLDELMAIHAEALRPSGRAADPGTLTAAEIVQRMRDEVLPASTGHGAFSDSVIDIASMETVPAELMPSESAGSTEDPRQGVDALRAGDRSRLFLHGRWHRVQLLWRSEKGLFLLFAGETAARTHSVTQRALERLAAAGLMQPLEARPLVQRALDVVMRAAGRVG